MEVGADIRETAVISHLLHLFRIVTGCLAKPQLSLIARDQCLKGSPSVPALRQTNVQHFKHLSAYEVAVIDVRINSDCPAPIV